MNLKTKMTRKNVQDGTIYVLYFLPVDRIEPLIPGLPFFFFEMTLTGRGKIPFFQLVPIKLNQPMEGYML